jgi:SAM-dependent methyltransferase
MNRRLYDLMYRWGAPWEGGPRADLVELVEGGELTPERLPPGRAIDLGCGSGANAVYLAQHGFDVVGVDFSAVALDKARQHAEAAGVASRVRFVHGDLTASSIPAIDGPFDLLVDYGTLDDLSVERRPRMAATIVRLARPGASFLLWCFYASRTDLPRISFSGPSRLSGAIAPGEETALFGDSFDIIRLPEPRTPFAAFLMRRRETGDERQSRT